jgi:hypothetical protein
MSYGASKRIKEKKKYWISFEEIIEGHKTCPYRIWPPTNPSILFD